MKILMPYTLRTQTLLAYRDYLESRGHTCAMTAYDGAEKLRRRAVSFAADVIVTSESAVLPRRTALPAPTVYAGSEFYCMDKRLPSDCAAYWTAHRDLDFAFLTCGAKQTRLREIGVPLPLAYMQRQSRSFALHTLGLAEEGTVFSLLTDGVSPNEIKATVHACETLCPDARLLLWSAERSRRVQWQTAFAELEHVYVPDVDAYMPLSLCSADAVFTPAFAVPVCAAVRYDRIVVLLHAASARARQNALFLDARGIAFCGKTAADNVSYACRLLDSTRLRRNMTDAQEKYILPDAEERAEKNLLEIVQS